MVSRVVQFRFTLILTSLRLLACNARRWRTMGSNRAGAATKDTTPDETHQPLLPPLPFAHRRERPRDHRTGCEHRRSIG